MKLFAGTLFFENTLPERLPELDIDMLIISQNGIYIMGGLEDGQTLSRVISDLESALGVRKFTDISCEEVNQQLEILTEELETGIYESVSFEGPEVMFDDIVERFLETESVIAVREAEISKIYGNKIIKVDFLY